MADVFLSYASEDRERIFPFVGALSSRGWSVWWDRQMIPGDSFEQTIDFEIGRASCIVVFWSESALKSRWVRNEALEGLEREALVPVRLEDVRVPVAFRQSQSVDLTGTLDTGSTGFISLCEAINQQVGSDPNVLTPAPKPPEDVRASIAVMPLRCASASDEDRFLLEGLLEGVTGRLARVPGFFVISSGTTINYLGQTVDSLSVGRSLGVRYIVDGTYRRSGNSVRVSARLTDTTNGEILWSEEHRLEVGSFEEAEDQLVDAVVARLQPELARAELARYSKSRPADMDAWALFQKANARFQLNGWHPEVIREAADLLDQATVKDPGFALAYACKSVLLGVGNRLAFWAEDHSQERAEAMQAAEKAMSLDDSDSRVLGFVGCALADFGATDRALPILDKALEMDPSNAQALVARGFALADKGLLERALADGERALQTSPRDARLAGWIMSHVNVLLRANRIDDALSCAEFACRRDSRLYLCWLMLAICHILKGDKDSARNATGEAYRIVPGMDRAQLQRILGSYALKLLDDANVWPAAWQQPA